MPQHLVTEPSGSNHNALSIHDESGGRFVVIMRTIPLSNSHKVAIVDDADYDDLSQYTWRLQAMPHLSNSLEYAVRHVERGVIMPMHRQILKPKSKQVVDHISGDGLDNQRENLRACTHQQNLWNRKPNTLGTSPYKGVYFAKYCGRWMAQIVVNGKKIRKTFSSEMDAARHYNLLAKTHYGEYARLNAV